MLVKVIVFAMVLVISLGGTLAFGSNITLVTSYAVIDKAGEPVLVVTVENRGDEPAHAVQSEITVDDAVRIGPPVRMLRVDEKTTGEYPLAGVLETPGRYPVVVRILYEDANGYRFSALTVGVYDHRSSIAPAVSITGRATEIPLDGTGRLEFVLRNEGLDALEIDTMLYLPNELSVTDEHARIDLGPRQDRVIGYRLENFAALANSSYSVSLIGRYRQAGSPIGVVGSAVVRISADAGSAARPIWIWVILGGLLPGVILFLRLNKFRSASRRGQR